MSDKDDDQSMMVLDADNVFKWKQLVQAKMLEKGCLKMVIPPEVTSDDDWDLTDIDHVKKRNRTNKQLSDKAKSVILKSVAPDTYLEICTLPTAKEMYDKAISSVLPKTFVTKWRLLSSVMTQKF